MNDIFNEKFAIPSVHSWKEEKPYNLQGEKQFARKPESLPKTRWKVTLRQKAIIDHSTCTHGITWLDHQLPLVPNINRLADIRVPQTPEYEESNNHETTLWHYFAVQTCCSWRQKNREHSSFISSPAAIPAIHRTLICQGELPLTNCNITRYFGEQIVNICKALSGDRN